MDHKEPAFCMPLPDEAATQQLGMSLAGQLTPGMRIYLTGQLGAGKTTLVRAMLNALGHAGRVKSPSYTLVESYTISRLYLYHFDFYRFKDPNEWIDSGFRDLFAGDAVCLVEWPEKALGFLPEPDLEISMAVESTGRCATLTAHSEPGKRCVSALKLQEGFS
jgi:tRNA threonylcarbamoyladenosine biosynthesis protein TsaE